MGHSCNFVAFMIEMCGQLECNLGWDPLKPFLLNPSKLYISGERGPLITNIEKNFKNFENYGSFWGSEISEIQYPS